MLPVMKISISKINNIKDLSTAIDPLCKGLALGYEVYATMSREVFNKTINRDLIISNSRRTGKSFFDHIRPSFYTPRGKVLIDIVDTDDLKIQPEYVLIKLKN